MRLTVTLDIPDICSACNAGIDGDVRLVALEAVKAFHVPCGAPPGAPGQYIVSEPVQPRGHPPAHSTEHFARVAIIYRAAADAGRPVARTVAEEWGVARSTANHWIARTKALGLLP